MCHDAAFAPRTVIASSSGSYAHSRSRPRSHASHVFLMRLRIGMHLMVLLFYFVLLMHPMCFIVRMVELLHPMWEPKARRVSLAFGFQILCN
jgi:hypothetical protein